MSRAMSMTVPLRLVWVVLIALALWRLGLFLDNGLTAVRYPYEYDYGEGIVWQQAVMMLDGRGYGDITRYPFIVFHYPPIYHLAASAVDSVLPGDWLVAGRAVSLAASLGSAALCAAMAASVDRPLNDRLAGAVIAAVMFISAAPVVLWGALARIDMLALLLGLAGLYAGIRSAGRPRLIHLASLLFVLALFTRQTAIFAPTALFGVLLVTRPRLALAGIASSTAFGLAGLAIMVSLTDGRFIDHAFLYNVNRFAYAHFAKIVRNAIGFQPMLWTLTGAMALGLVVAAVRARRSGGWRAAIAASPGNLAPAVSLAYLATSLLSFVLVAKIGSNVNYFVDLCAAAAMVIGIATARLPALVPAGRPLGRLIAPMLAIVVCVSAIKSVPQVYRERAGDKANIAVLDRTLAEIRAANKPVLSDDMVLLRKAGRQVPWESAIFSELGYAGLWDERPLVQMIDQQRFAFLRTAGSTGSPLFNARYRSAVRAAIDRAYPVKVRRGEFVNHYPVPAR